MTNQHMNRRGQRGDGRQSGREWRVTAEAAGTTLQSFIAGSSGVSRRKAKELIDSRCVLVNRKRVWMCNHRLESGDTIELSAGFQQAEKRDLDVLFRDDFCFIIDKPPGLLSDGIGSAEEFARRQFNNPEILAVHRLDRDTSGCLLFAWNAEAKRELVPVFKSHKVTKVYHVIVSGQCEEGETKCSLPVDGQHAVTYFRTLDSSREATHLQARIETGRTHQIRKHLASLGLFVVGDRFYGVKNRVSTSAMKIRRQMLHASSIEFMSPLTGRRVRAKSNLPGDFRKTLALFNLS